jgi:hypothetical protein
MSLCWNATTTAGVNNVMTSLICWSSSSLKAVQVSSHGYVIDEISKREPRDEVSTDQQIALF